MFRSDFFIQTWDLSTNGMGANSSFLIPAIRLGHVRLEMRFSNPTPEELTLLIYSDYPSLLSINKDLKVNTSYET
jgi:hypothetical protein